MVPELTIEYIRGLDVNNAFEEYTDRYDDKTKESIEKYKLIRFGINLKFDFYDWKIGLLEINPKSGSFYHKSKRTNYPTEKVFTELEKRKRLIKEELYNMIENTSVTQVDYEV